MSNTSRGGGNNDRVSVHLVPALDAFRESSSLPFSSFSLPFSFSNAFPFVPRRWTREELESLIEQELPEFFKETFTQYRFPEQRHAAACVALAYLRGGGVIVSAVPPPMVYQETAATTASATSNSSIWSEETASLLLKLAQDPHVALLCKGSPDPMPTWFGRCLDAFRCSEHRLHNVSLGPVLFASRPYHWFFKGVLEEMSRQRRALGHGRHLFHLFEPLWVQLYLSRTCGPQLLSYCYAAHALEDSKRRSILFLPPISDHTASAVTSTSTDITTSSTITNGDLRAAMAVLLIVAWKWCHIVSSLTAAWKKDASFQPIDRSDPAACDASDLSMPPLFFLPPAAAGREPRFSNPQNMAELLSYPLPPFRTSTSSSTSSNRKDQEKSRKEERQQHQNNTNDVKKKDKKKEKERGRDNDKDDDDDTTPPWTPLG
jgi:hypothetical protein